MFLFQILIKTEGNVRKKSLLSCGKYSGGGERFNFWTGSKLVFKNDFPEKS